MTLTQNSDYPKGPRLCIMSSVLDMLPFRCLWYTQVYQVDFNSVLCNKTTEISAYSLVSEARFGVRDSGVIRIQVLIKLMAINAEQKKRLRIRA